MIVAMVEIGLLKNSTRCKKQHFMFYQEYLGIKLRAEKDLKEFVENLQELFKDRRQMTSSELSEKNFVNSKSEGLAYSLHKTRRTFPDFPVFCIPYEICVVRNLF